MAFSADIPPHLTDPSGTDRAHDDTPRLEAPVILSRFKWPIAALWISLGLHAALIALVQVAPPSPVTSGGSIEARLVTVPAAPAVARINSSIESPATLAATVPKTQVMDTQTAPAQPVVEHPQPQAQALPRLEIPLAVDLHYYSARELDQTPSGNISDPVFPEALSGSIRFEVKIEEDGHVSEVKVLQTEPPNIFDGEALENAIQALRTTRFTPGIKNARPVRAVVVYLLTINPVVLPRP